MKTELTAPDKDKHKTKWTHSLQESNQHEHNMIELYESKQYCQILGPKVTFLPHFFNCDI